MGRFKVIGEDIDIVHRWEGNPFLTLDDLDFRCADIRNAGVATLNGKTVLLVTIGGLRGNKRLHLATEEENGRFHVRHEPFISPATEPPASEHESHGLLDARITFLEDYYYIMFMADGDHGYRLELARTKDFNEIERMGLVSEPDTKGGAIFPERINGRYARVERPGEGRSLWISYSSDMIYWGGAECLIHPRPGYWDASWVGVGCPPIAIERGWLIIYYGAKDTSAGPIYRLGAAILDKTNPTVIIGRSNIPILSPRERYERIGDLPNIVFTTGAQVFDNGELKIYYGAADSCLCIGHTTISEIVRNCIESEERF